jgi:hypothetical protein
LVFEADINALGAIKSVFEAAGPAKLQIAIQTMPLSEIESAWKARGNPALAFLAQLVL